MSMTAAQRYKNAKATLSHEIDYFASLISFPMRYRTNDIRDGLRYLAEVESELAQSDPWLLPDKESEALKLRAKAAFKESKRMRCCGSATLQVKVSSEVADWLRCTANTLRESAGYEESDFISPDELAAILLEAYTRVKCRGNEVTIPASVMVEETKKHKELPIHNLSEAQKNEISRLVLEEDMRWRDAQNKVMKDGNKVVKRSK